MLRTKRFLSCIIQTLLAVSHEMVHCKHTLFAPESMIIPPNCHTRLPNNTSGRTYVKCASPTAR